MVNPKQSPPPATGSTDQYEMGDLSGKFGTLDDYQEYSTSYNDTNLPLFGYETVLGNVTHMVLFFFLKHTKSDSK